MSRSVTEYVASLGLDAWMVGGAVRDSILGREVRDTDFVVPGMSHAELRAALAKHGRVEDLVVAGQHVGVRLWPGEARARALAPAGIEFTPPRAERSTGPGRHDFEIVADASISLADDMRRRDFTINAIAERLATRERLDPLGGRADLERGVLRTTAAESFRDDPLRIVRGLRFVSELDLEPDPATLEQMREWAPQVRFVSAERIGGGLAADGHGELSKLLLGRHPRKALRLARDTGVLIQLLPEFERVIGFEDEWQPLPLEEHIFAVVQATAAAGAGLAIRLAALLHDVGKPASAGDVGAHAAVGARVAATVLRRLRYPVRLSEHVTRIVRHHAFDLPRDAGALAARRFLRVHGDELAFDLVDHRDADVRAEGAAGDLLDRIARFRSLLEGERSSPHTIADLAIDGSDLIAIGYREGPEVGRALQALLDEVVDEPSLNERGRLLEHARRRQGAPA